MRMSIMKQKRITDNGVEFDGGRKETSIDPHND